MKKFSKVIFLCIIVAIVILVLTVFVLLPKRTHKRICLHEEMVNTYIAKYGKFGGGYQNAKWGMNPNQVKKAMELSPFNIIAEESDRIEAKHKEKGVLTFKFHQDKLYEVIYEPKLGDGDKEGVEAIIQILEEKFGPYERSYGIDRLFKFPLDLYKWSDGETEIIFRVWQENPLLFSGGDRLGAQLFPERYYPSSSAMVHYRSVKLYVNMEEIEKHEKIERKKEDYKKFF